MRLSLVEKTSKGNVLLAKKHPLAAWEAHLPSGEILRKKGGKHNIIRAIEEKLGIKIAKPGKKR